MKNRDDWIREAKSRQDNIDPIRQIPNIALFQGTLIKGHRRLNPAQRIGALVFGLTSWVYGCLFVPDIVRILQARRLPDPSVVFCLFFLWAGWKITINAIVNDPERLRKKRLTL